MKETTIKKIAEIQSRVNDVVADHSLRIREKERVLSDIYLDARDYKSTGNLVGEGAWDVIEYDNEAMMYAFQTLQKIQKQAEKEYGQ